MVAITCWVLCGSTSKAYYSGSRACHIYGPDKQTDRMKRKHQAVNRLDIVHGTAVKRLRDRYHSQYTPPPAPAQEWKPKNPEITWPTMRHESPLTKAEWMETVFPAIPFLKR